MATDLRFKDYFSIKILGKFGINPEKALDLSAPKGEILSEFKGATEEDLEKLSGKLKAACADNGLELNTSVRQKLDIAELDEGVFDDDVAEVTDESVLEMNSPQEEKGGRSI